MVCELQGEVLQMSTKLRNATCAAIVLGWMVFFVGACATSKDAQVPADIAVIEGDFTALPMLFANFFETLEIDNIVGEKIDARRAEVAPGQHTVAVKLSMVGIGMPTGWCEWDRPLHFRFVAEGGHTYKIDVDHWENDIVLKDLTMRKELTRKDYHPAKCR